MAGKANFNRHDKSGSIERLSSESESWRLSVPPGPANQYRWAQLDDYSSLPRSRFLWRPPVTLALDARVSSLNLPGTWGFGFWNDPFNISLGLGGSVRRLPALPNSAWFFHASPPNYLSLRDDLPAQGFLAATFRSPHIPVPLMALGVPFLPLLKWSWMARLLRRPGSRMVHQSAALLTIDSTQWHHYALTWMEQQVVCEIDGKKVMETSISPRGPLGLVLWIDNHYAAFTPQGKISLGTLPGDQTMQLELKNISLENHVDH